MSSSGGRSCEPGSWPPARLATPQTELDMDLFMAVTTELGDVVLGPPGTMPADADGTRADRR